MGADFFSNEATGTTAEEAFRSAVDQAKYDHGHAGYSGTLAEKDSFVMIQQEPLPRQVAHALADKLIDDGDERVDGKWGPAGCIPIQSDVSPGGARVFLFFGWASS